MELRAKIVEAIEASWTEADDLDPFAAADAILAIPEIRDALEWRYYTKDTQP